MLYADEASVCLHPTITTTYAPIGQTPSIAVSTEVTTRLYLASAISEQGDLEYMVRNKPFDSTAIIEFLNHLMVIFTQKLLIIWDGASIHDSKEVRNFLTTLPKDKLHLVKQPFYSPELNGDEQVWSYLKNHQLKNTCIQNIKELHHKIDNSMNEMKKKPDLIPSFFKHPKLGFYNFS